LLRFDPGYSGLQIIDYGVDDQLILENPVMPQTIRCQYLAVFPMANNFGELSLCDFGVGLST